MSTAQAFLAWIDRLPITAQERYEGTRLAVEYAYDLVDTLVEEHVEAALRLCAGRKQRRAE
jgi:hypothetical protein